MKRNLMKFEPTNYKFECGSYQVWAMFKDRTAAKVAGAFKRAVDAAREAEEYATGFKTCQYRRANIERFLVCKCDIKEIVRLKKKIVPEFKIITPPQKG